MRFLIISLENSHNIIILRFCNIVEGQATCLDKFRQVWTHLKHLDAFGHVSTHLDMFGRIWTGLGQVWLWTGFGRALEKFEEVLK